ncbi:KinB-signaling pathway activation protein [Bacillus benzoevorans]|uniref:KinB-signaling pathway activation protein n=1 Tax=Bacillus benzoevorans TaxID=1456 RepID=UPI0016186C27
MTSRNVVHLFFTTLFIGGVVTVITGFIVRWNEFEPYFMNFDIIKIFSTLLWLFGVGMTFSAISQMGFFAYLTVHRFGLGIFKAPSLWNGIQIVLILFVLFDLVYFRYKSFAEAGEGILPYLAPAVMILIVASIVAYFKVRQTNKSAFIPAVFFMIVITVIEWVPVLRPNETSWVYLMIFPLLVCNTYQLLILHRLNEKSQKERDERSKEKGNKASAAKKAGKKAAEKH